MFMRISLFLPLSLLPLPDSMLTVVINLLVAIFFSPVLLCIPFAFCANLIALKAVLGTFFLPFIFYAYSLSLPISIGTCDSSSSWSRPRLLFRIVITSSGPTTFFFLILYSLYPLVQIEHAIAGSLLLFFGVFFSQVLLSFFALMWFVDCFVWY